jgi:hypothetical protein
MASGISVSAKFDTELASHSQTYAGSSSPGQANNVTGAGLILFVLVVPR